MIIQVFFNNEVIIRMLKILKMSQNLNKKKILPIKMKIVSQNHLRKDQNKNNQISKILNSGIFRQIINFSKRPNYYFFKNFFKTCNE